MHMRRTARGAVLFEDRRFAAMFFRNAERFAGSGFESSGPIHTCGVEDPPVRLYFTRRTGRGKPAKRLGANGDELVRLRHLDDRIAGYGFPIVAARFAEQARADEDRGAPPLA